MVLQGECSMKPWDDRIGHLAAAGQVPQLTRSKRPDYPIGTLTSRVLK